MRRARHRTRGLARLGGALLVVLWLTAPAAAQTPLSELQFFASHNAYQRSDPEELIWDSDTNVVTMIEQLDEWNVWHMEIDLFYFEWVISPIDGRTDQDPPFSLTVGHTFLDSRGLTSFASIMNAIGQTRRMQEGFAIIHFQMSDNLDSNAPGQPIRGRAPDVVEPTEFERLIRAEILQYISPSIVYTQDDFDADGFLWPTPEELVRRGKHVAFYLSRRASAEEDQESFFLKGGGRSATITDSAMWKLGTETVAADPLVASYRFPEDLMESPQNWDTAMNNGHNFVGTTTLGARRFDPRFHPPVPTYVDLGTRACPIPGSCGGGTWLSRDRVNFSGGEALALGRAIQRVESWETTTGKRSIVPIRIIGTPPSGPIVFSGATTDYVIDTAVELQNGTGADLVLE